MKKIQRIAVRNVRGYLNRRVCDIDVAGKSFSWPFHDLVEFSDGLQDVLAETERLVPTNAARPADRTFMQIEGLRVSDAVENNRNLYSGREVRERRDEGQHIAGGNWYMELGVNGADNDMSFNTVTELFQLVQIVMKRELAVSGAIVTETPAVLVARA